MASSSQSSGQVSRACTRWSAISGVNDWITGITDNLKWLAGAVAVAAVVVIGLLFLTGHSRAQDYAIRFGVGCAILAGGTGIVA